MWSREATITATLARSLPSSQASVQEPGPTALPGPRGYAYLVPALHSVACLEKAVAECLHHGIGKHCKSEPYNFLFPRGVDFSFKFSFKVYLF